MASKYNALTQKVCYDENGQTLLIRSAINSTWYLVQPWGKPEEGRLMNIQQLAKCHDFEDEISYVNRLKQKLGRGEKVNASVAA